MVPVLWVEHAFPHMWNNTAFVYIIWFGSNIRKSTHRDNKEYMGLSYSVERILKLFKLI